MTTIPILAHGGQPIIGTKYDHYCEQQYSIAPEAACDAEVWELGPDAASWPEPKPGNDLDRTADRERRVDQLVVTHDRAHRLIDQLIELPLEARQRHQRERLTTPLDEAVVDQASARVANRQLHIDVLFQGRVQDFDRYTFRDYLGGGT